MDSDIKRDPDLEWLDHVRPVGLVVAPSLLKELGLSPLRQSAIDSSVVAELLGNDGSKPALRDPWQFVERVLGWESRHVAGSPGGPAIPDELLVALPEHGTTLAPDWAVAELGGEQGWQLLVRIEAPGVDPDSRGALDGWEATPHQRFERLLRDTSVFAGLLVTERAARIDDDVVYHPELRLIYAPRGETSGHLIFPLRPLGEVAGRPMLGGLKLLLDGFRLFSDADDRRLPALLKKSREAQAAVSTALAGQVLGALHELLRGLDGADPNLIRELAASRPDHLYEGLLAVLMRLVFILYAEDRDLLPSRSDARAREIYESSYSVRGLYARLVEDAALNPDTMDERRGGWGRLLALFRLIYKGHRTHFVQARGGKLFDPDEYPFLEGRASKDAHTRVVPVSDGCLLRILEGLMTLKLRGGERERLSYRALDVEQIGSVYETVMGFTAKTTVGRVLAIKGGKHNRTPVFIELERLLETKGKERIKFLKQQADRTLSASHAKCVESAKSPEDLAQAFDAIVDERASPRKRIAPAGTPILQPTDERRRTGSHYTPRSLTAPIVKYALEPAFERLGENATPAQILDLKLCDPAMGSGAFLVEACRQMAERLVKAWERHKDKKPAVPADEDEELHARRLVAQHCLYGVDKNPRAVDLAKLSLWLATLARDHEFTFLDHALKCGDSLGGLSRAQIAAVHWDAEKPATFVGKLVGDHLREAERLRARIREQAEWASEADLRPLLKAVDAKLAIARLIGDGVIAAFFSADKQKKRLERLVEFQKTVQSNLGSTRWTEAAALFTAALRSGTHPLTPFHWEIEFPEVFARDNGGFDAIVGNPPFLGGRRVSETLGDTYNVAVCSLLKGAKRSADLCAHFFRNAYFLIRGEGAFGLIATNTIAQGNTRHSSLGFIIAQGGSIFRAIKRLKWPGEAAVIVSVIHCRKGQCVHSVLNGAAVKRISAYLQDADYDGDPFVLNANSDMSYMGSLIRGMGFTFDDDPQSAYANPLAKMNHMIARHPEYAYRIKPFIGGEEVANDPRHLHRRYVIDLSGTEKERAWEDFPGLMEILQSNVKPERDRIKNKRVAHNWWLWEYEGTEIYQYCRRVRRFLAINAGASPHMSFAFLPTDLVFAHTLIVFPLDKNAHFTALQSRPHEVWARFFASSMKDDLRYTPSDCFETFPFPAAFESSSELETAGQAYHDHRATLMIARSEGMTKTYNRFHDRSEKAEDVARLRELHAKMDRAVLEAYGWHDLAERAEPIFLDETNEDDHTYQGRLFWPSDFRDEVLSRLLALNAERHAEEVRLGIAPGMNGKKVEEMEEEELEDAED